MTGSLRVRGPVAQLMDRGHRRTDRGQLATDRGPPQRSGPPGGPARPTYAPRPQRELDRGDCSARMRSSSAASGRSKRHSRRAEGAIRLLVVPERRAALDPLVVHATTLRIPVVELEGGSADFAGRFRRSPGHCSRSQATAGRPTWPTSWPMPVQRGGQPFVLVLNSLEDPQNFGTLLRSAGGDRRGRRGLSRPAEQRHCPPFRDQGFGGRDRAHAPGTCRRPRRRVGGPARPGSAHRRCGRECLARLLRGRPARPAGARRRQRGQGHLGHRSDAACDLSVRIPMRGKIASLNASVAGSLLLFAAAAQRPGPTEGRPRRQSRRLRQCRQRQAGNAPGGCCGAQCVGGASGQGRGQGQGQGQGQAHRTRPSPRPRTSRRDAGAAQAHPRNRGQAQGATPGAEAAPENRRPSPSAPGPSQPRHLSRP